MRPDDVWAMSAVELAKAIREFKLSPVEVIRSFLDRIESVNPQLNALVTIEADSAVAAAKRAEQALLRGEKVGPLHGVPFHVKDNLLVAGSRTTFGSKLQADHVPTDDCPAVEMLRRGGAIVIGRSNTPEYGWKGVTDNRVFGPTRNPWNLDLTPGGSSGGAAAAVAAGMGPIGLGTDGGGSLRIPAAFCGVVGFKASFGRVPNWPGSSGAMLRHIGPIARSTSDIALALDVIAHPDRRDLLSLPVDVSSPPAGGGGYLSSLDAGLKGRRVAYSPNLGYAQVQPEVAETCARAAGRLSEAGAVVETVDLDWSDPYPAWSAIFFGTAAASLADKLESQGELLDPGLRSVVESGLRQSGADFGRALAARHAFWEQVRRLYERFDLLVCPTLPLPPFAVGHDDAPSWSEEQLEPLQWTRFTYPFNLTGQPAASVPAGWTNSGLPVGLQIVGDRHADRLVLQAARALEQIQPWSDRWPPIERQNARG